MKNRVDKSLYSGIMGYSSPKASRSITVSAYSKKAELKRRKRSAPYRNTKQPSHPSGGFFTPGRQVIKRVFCITYCRRPELYYGTSLIFQTIRAGFPDAEIVVIDNASAYGVEETRRLAESVGAIFVPYEKERRHQDILADIVIGADVPTAVVDPDIVFWDRADESTAMLEGRLIPCFLDPYTGCHTHERLHTSFLKFRPELREAIREVRAHRFDWEPFSAVMLEMDGWHRWDTMASLYASLKHIAKPFSESDLNKYDHLFCGSHIDLVADKLNEWGDKFRAMHESARVGDLEALRGIWKLQDTFFRQFAPE